MKERFLSILEETGVVAVIRMDDASQLLQVVRALNAGGVRLVEITMTVPGALETVQAIKNELGDKTGVMLGAGTVLDGVTARLAILHGADYIVSPVFDQTVVDMCKSYGIPVSSGCMTPTEIFTAWKAGVDVIKTFPGRVCTPGFYSDIFGPFPFVKMMPTGNVDFTTAPEYIRAGAVAVGVGKALVDVKKVKENKYDEITENAQKFIELIRKVKTEKNYGK